MCLHIPDTGFKGKVHIYMDCIPFTFSLINNTLKTRDMSAVIEGVFSLTPT